MGTVSTVTGPIVYLVFYHLQLILDGKGNPAALIDATWSLALIAALTEIVSALEQLFFVWRIWILGMGNRKFLPLVIIIILFVKNSLQLNTGKSLNSKDVILKLTKLKELLIIARY
ncbi:hypothetical protein C8R42DRAFT_638065 [Lentinula raphanica]|nr:hypothetical protein C8R42DRAFT_638065 [Lentinula raphanica]